MVIADDRKDDKFDAFWAVYPRKSGKQEAKKAWDKAIKQTPAGRIIEAAGKYASDPNREDEFTKHPSTWLNQGCWDDDPLPQRRGTSTAQQRSDYMADIIKRAAQQDAINATRLELES